MLGGRQAVPCWRLYIFAPAFAHAVTTLAQKNASVTAGAVRIIGGPGLHIDGVGAVFSNNSAKVGGRAARVTEKNENSRLYQNMNRHLTTPAENSIGRRGVLAHGSVFTSDAKPPEWPVSFEAARDDDTTHGCQSVTTMVRLVRDIWGS